MIEIIFLGIYVLVLTFIGIMISRYGNKGYNGDGGSSTFCVAGVLIVFAFLIFGFLKTYETKTDITEKCTLWNVHDGICAEYNGKFYTNKSISARKFKHHNPTIIFIDEYSIFSNKSKNFNDRIKIEKGKEKKKEIKKKIKKEKKKEINKKNITTLN